jgi:hypothetical protein
MITQNVFHIIYDDYVQLFTNESLINIVDMVNHLISKYESILEDENHPDNHAGWIGLGCAQLHTQFVTFRVFRTVRKILDGKGLVRFAQSLDYRDSALREKTLRTFLLALEEQYEVTIKRMMQ